jgi:hypothetical protein
MMRVPFGRNTGMVVIIALLRSASHRNHFTVIRGGSFIIREGVDNEITGKRDTSLFGNRRGNGVGANLRPGPDGPIGYVARQSGAKERDFQIL